MPNRVETSLDDLLSFGFDPEPSDPDEAERGTDECECYDCQYNQETDSAGVHRYSYKPWPIFRGKSDRGLYLGMELEVEVGDHRNYNRAAKLANEQLGNLVYLKEDSSIHCGFEIVTHPMTHDYAIGQFPWQTLVNLREMGCRTNQNNGIHIHVSRAGFSGPSHILRWLLFCYGNQRPIETVARRVSHYGDFEQCSKKFANWVAKGWPNIKWPEHGLVRKLQQDRFQQSFSYYSPDRFSAINLRNTETLELRVFRSTLSPQRAKAALDLTHASVEYARAINSRTIIKEDGLSWDRFLAWADEEDIYDNLIREWRRLN